MRPATKPNQNISSSPRAKPPSKPTRLCLAGGRGRCAPKSSVEAEGRRLMRIEVHHRHAHPTIALAIPLPLQPGAARSVGAGAEGEGPRAIAAAGVVGRGRGGPVRTNRSQRILKSFLPEITSHASSSQKCSCGLRAGGGGGGQDGVAEEPAEEERRVVVRVRADRLLRSTGHESEGGAMSAAHSRSLFGAHPSVRKSMNKQNQLDRQIRHERPPRLWRGCTHLHGPVAEQAIVVADQTLPRHHRHVVVRQHAEPVHQPQAVQVGVRDAEHALVADGVAFAEPDLGTCGAQRRWCERRSPMSERTVVCKRRL